MICTEDDCQNYREQKNTVTFEGTTPPGFPPPPSHIVYSHTARSEAHEGTPRHSSASTWLLTRWRVTSPLLFMETTPLWLRRSVILGVFGGRSVWLPPLGCRAGLPPLLASRADGDGAPGLLPTAPCRHGLPTTLHAATCRVRFTGVRRADGDSGCDGVRDDVVGVGMGPWSCAGFTSASDGGLALRPLSSLSSSWRWWGCAWWLRWWWLRWW